MKISTFLPVLNSPDSVLNLSGLMKNKGKHTISSSLRPGSKALTGKNNLLVIFLKV